MINNFKVGDWYKYNGDGVYSEDTYLKVVLIEKNRVFFENTNPINDTINKLSTPLTTESVIKISKLELSILKMQGKIK